MPVAGVVVRIRDGAGSKVASLLDELDGVEVVEQTDDGFALVIEADTARQQRELHERIADWSEVEQASVVLQSGEF